MTKIKTLAYYLPQFHPIGENDLWWGKGFTEWTSVAKAKPLFKGHQQPKIPADLGFYDLRLPETRELQVQYAKMAGISAFCYWHYWFGNGKRLLNFPLDEVVRLKKPDFPFCLAWANHSWHQKTWVASKAVFSKAKSKLLIEQKYPGEEDNKNHFYTMLPVFQDKRYFKINNRLVFVIYAPQEMPDLNAFMNYWQKLAQKERLPGFYFIGHTYTYELLEKLRIYNFDAINFSMHQEVFANSHNHKNLYYLVRNGVNRRFRVKPRVLDYRKIINTLDSPLYDENKIYPTIIPNWDHTPRSGNFGRVYKNCTPELFKEHVNLILERIKNKPPDDKIVFLKSWNEWGEGNYLEPDLNFGTKYIDILNKELKMY